MSQVLFIGAAIAFAIDAFKQPLGWATTIGFTALGFCLLTIALFLL